MNILITGGTGFIGNKLCVALIDAGHKLTLLTRQSKPNRENITYISAITDLTQDDSFEVIINLAGEPIANKRWSHQQKNKITQSRFTITEQLINYIKNCRKKPTTFISASAIGFYGIKPSNEEVTEHSTGDHSFSSLLCAQWEGIAKQAEAFAVRVCLLRTGIVLGRGGAMSKLLPQYKLGLGGKLGDGTQWMPWIHIDDEINIILQCISNKNLSGAINCTAPTPVTNRAFNTALAASVNRPAFMSMPALAIKLLFGQMGNELLLNGKKVIPQKLLDQGFNYQYSELNKALNSLTRQPSD